MAVKSINDTVINGYYETFRDKHMPGTKNALSMSDIKNQVAIFLKSEKEIKSVELLIERLEQIIHFLEVYRNIGVIRSFFSEREKEEIKGRLESMNTLLLSEKVEESKFWRQPQNENLKKLIQKQDELFHNHIFQNLRLFVTIYEIINKKTANDIESNEFNNITQELNNAKQEFSNAKSDFENLKNETMAINANSIEKNKIISDDFNSGLLDKNFEKQDQNYRNMRCYCLAYGISAATLYVLYNVNFVLNNEALKGDALTRYLLVNLSVLPVFYLLTVLVRHFNRTKDLRDEYENRSLAAKNLLTLKTRLDKDFNDDAELKKEAKKLYLDALRQMYGPLHLHRGKDDDETNTLLTRILDVMKSRGKLD